MPAKSLRAIILENAVSANPLAPRDLAREKNLKVETIYRVMARLRADGVLPRSHRSPRKAITTEPLPVTTTLVETGGRRGAKFNRTREGEWTQEQLDEVVNSEVMPELERLQKLSYMARFGPDAISIQAIKALEDLYRAKGTTVGPGAPLTEEDQVTRLSRLMMAVGRSITDRALSTAFPPVEAPDELPQAQDAPLDEGLSDSPSEVG